MKGPRLPLLKMYFYSIFIVKLAKNKPPPTLQNELLLRENETLLIRACAATVK